MVSGVHLCAVSAVIQLFLSTENRGRRKKKVTVAGLVLVITLTGSGCAAVEPEKRAYPLALGAGVSENGFVLKYAMPDMSTATGQEKPDEDPISVLTLSGRDFQEIEAGLQPVSGKISGSGSS